MQSSTASVNLSIEHPDQSRSQENPTSNRPKNPSIAELSGEQLFFDMVRDGISEVRKVGSALMIMTVSAKACFNAPRVAGRPKTKRPQA